MIEPRYFSIPLKRNNEYTAFVRETDYSLIFTKNKNGNTPKGGLDETPECKELFSRYEQQIKDSQPDNLISEEKKRTFTTYLILSDKCNLKCTYCDVLSNENYMDYGKMMSWEIAKQAMDLIQKRLIAEPNLYAQVTFFGGEPLINWPILKKVCEYIDTMEHKERVDKMIVTNGVLINKEKAEFLLEHEVYVVVSIDGMQEANDTARVTHGTASAHKGTVKGLDVLKEVMPNQFGLSCVLGSHNASNLPEQIDYLYERFNPISIGINMYHYRQDGSCPIKVDDELLIQSQMDAFEICRSKGIAIYQYVGILKALMSRKRNKDYCPACVDKLLYLPEGKVGRCETMVFNDDFNFSLEQLMNNDIPKHMDWRKYTPTYEPACQSCDARWICPGSCPYDQFITTGDLGGVEERRCNFHKTFMYSLLDLVLDSALETAGPEDILIPVQKDFEYIAGNIPMKFPKNTVYIVGTGPVYDIATK